MRLKGRRVCIYYVAKSNISSDETNCDTQKRTTDKTTVDCHWESMESGSDENKVSCSCFITSIVITNLQYCNVQGMWHSPNTLPTVVHYRF